MKLTAITFKASCQLTFMREEVELLMYLSAQHYDAHSREVGQERGFLFGLNNRYVVLPDMGIEQNAESSTLSFREIDTLCKILEMTAVGTQSDNDGGAARYAIGIGLQVQLRDCLHRLNNICGLMQEVR